MKRLRLTAFALATTIFAIVWTPPASAALTYAISSLSAEVSGTSVTATATLKSSLATVVDRAGICARTSSGANADFPAQTSVSVGSGGVTLSATTRLAPGTYTYWTCLYDAGVWSSAGDIQYLTVPSAASQTAASSGVPMPVGNLPGWKQVFTEDFTTPLARGSFPGAYGKKWQSYTGFPNTSRTGDYDQRIISAQDGNLDLYLHSANGRALGAAPVPLVNGQWGGQTYGRFSVRLKADALPGYGVAFLLWSDANNWDDGEINFPESTNLKGVAMGYNHCPGNPTTNCLEVNSSTKFTGWHTYTIEWTRAKLSFLVDGRVVGSTTSNIPSKPLHWVMQTETSSPSASTNGHVLIDWATIYTVD